MRSDSTPDPGERSRLAALERYKIVGSEAEQLYDDITLLASAICEVPISLISLVEWDRQWFKSSVGLPLTETPRAMSFCAHAVNKTGTLQIPDARSDLRFAENPLVTGDPHIRFYAGAPLVTPDGYTLGTLCVIDTVPRQLMPEKLRALEALSRQVMALLDARLKTMEIESAAAQILKHEKLAAVGRLASSIAHEINNPLEAVTNLIYLVRSDETLSQSGRDFLDAADRELRRMSQVTSQTLRFHRQSTKPLTVSPALLLEEVLALHGARLTNSRIQVERLYAPAVSFTCYEGDIRQVLNNLVGNAVDAMPYGGKLTVRTKYARRWSDNASGVRITIADTGFGMSSEVKARIFDAFFSTKGIGGTGLGLWISSRIVHKHRGHIRPSSSTCTARHGTVMSLWLPIHLAETAGESWDVN